MREISGTDKQKKLVQIVLDEKEVALLADDIESLQYDDTKYKSVDKFEYDKKILLETPWNISAVLQNKHKKISEIVEMNFKKQGIAISGKKLFSALRNKYKQSSKIDDNIRAEEI